MARLLDRFVNVDQVSIHLVDWEGGEPPILLVHGLTANAMGCAIWAESLAPKYRVITPDLRGRGDSDKPVGPYGTAQHAKDMESVLNALNIDKVVFIGQSLGAMIGLQFAADYPERVHKLVFGDAAGLITDPAEQQEFALSIGPAMAFVGTTYPSKEAYINSWKENPFWKSIWSKQLEAYIEASVEVLPNGTARSKTLPEATTQDRMALIPLDYDSLYVKVKCPTLIIRAPQGISGIEKGIAVPPAVADRALRSIQNCRIYDAKGTNHLSLFYAKHPEVMKELIKFMEE